MVLVTEAWPPYLSVQMKDVASELSASVSLSKGGVASLPVRSNEVGTGLALPLKKKWPLFLPSPNKRDVVSMPVNQNKEGAASMSASPSEFGMASVLVSHRKGGVASRTVNPSNGGVSKLYTF